MTARASPTTGCEAVRPRTTGASLLVAPTDPDVCEDGSTIWDGSKEANSCGFAQLRHALPPRPTRSQCSLVEAGGSALPRAEHTDEEFLDAVRRHNPAGTSEVAEAVGCTTQNADYRLRQLEDMARVESKKVGRSLVWTLPGGESEV